MAQATFHFPRGFLWGTATSSHQVEGNNTNNTWWAWEGESGHIAQNHKSGSACDWWGGRWREDFDRAVETGQNAHRLSIEWSRVQPAPDRWDEDALDYYREMLRGLHERGLTSLVTLHHFTDPLWFAEMGGFENENAAMLFQSYVAKVVEALQEYNTLWITFNEPNLYVLFGFSFGLWPPGKKQPMLMGKVIYNLVLSHAAAYHAIHRLQPQARVGLAHHYRSSKPARSWFPPDRLMSGFQSRMLNEVFPVTMKEGVLHLPFSRKRIPEARGSQDFLGINYYTRDRVAFSLLKPRMFFTRQLYPDEADLSDEGFIANEPEGLFEAFTWARRFEIPIIVTENGVNDVSDHMRPRYMVQHIHQVWRAVNFNYKIKGYFWWSLVDNFEWERGWTQRFGLWELDIETQGRRKRPSADLYAEICHENALSSEMVARYAPDILAQMFPG